MSAATMLVLLLALACFGSFAWAMRRFFTQPEARAPAMTAIYTGGAVFSGVHLVAIAGWHRPAPLTTAAGALLYLGALGLFWWAVQVNRRRPLSIAYSQDRPQWLVTEGPYRLVRHPFYSAYTLAWIAGAVVVPAPWLLATAAIMFLLYLGAARQEEEKFSRSPLADEHAAYRRSVGMFWPRWPKGGVPWHASR